MKNLRTAFWLNWLLLFLIILLIGLRFVHLSADFPSGITHYGVLYTDEGWYSNAAVADFLTRQWYVEGDFNPAVNLPLFPLVQALTFKLFGLSLAAARSTVVFFFALLLVVLYFFIEGFTDEPAALLAAAILAINYPVFAFSRLAILEIPMVFFIVLSLLLASKGRAARAYLMVFLAALALFCAVLTKTSSVFAFPLLLYLVWAKESSRKERGFQLALVIGSLLVFSSLYYLVVVRTFPVDYQYFNSLNVTSRLRLSGFSFLGNLTRAVISGFFLDKLLYPTVLLCSVVLFFTTKKFRKDVLLSLAVFWFFLYLMMIALNGYFPPRYYVPLAVPLVIIIARLFEFIWQAEKMFIIKTVFAAALIISATLNFTSIARYLSSPQYSFLNMAQDVKRIIESTNARRNVLLGNFTNTVSLVSGIFSVNDTLSTQNLEFKLQKYQPNYYLSTGIIKPENHKILNRHYRVNLLKTYDVFNNYYSGRRVYFYALLPR